MPVMHASHSKHHVFKHNAFSLVELLVVIAILTMLISILLPVLGEARKQAQLTRCRNQLRQITAGAAIYSIEFRGRYPITPYLLRGGTTHSSDDASTKHVLQGPGDLPPTGNNPTGWYQLRTLQHVQDKSLDCPSLDASPGSGIAQNLNQLGNYYRLSYGYRYNTFEANHELPQRNKETATTGNYPRAQGQGSMARVLFNDGSSYRRSTLAPYEEIHGAGRGHLKYQWAHVTGGNVALFDGSAHFMPNFLPPSTHGGRQFAAWPNVNFLAPYAVGSYSSKGNLYSMDAYAKNLLSL